VPLSTQKRLEKGVNGVREGRQTETGEQEAQPGDKVVRLPRDWLGPREELVPFGPRAGSAEAGEPPSPSDFWGEQSAAIQSAVQAPPTRDDPAGSDGGIRIDRRALAAAAAVLAVAAAVTMIALVSSSVGPGAASQSASGSKLGFAAVLSDAVSSVMQQHVGASVAAAGPRHKSAAKQSHKRARPRPKLAVRSPRHLVRRTAPVVPASSSSYHPATVDTSATAGSTDTHPETSPATRPAPPQSQSRPVASRATVHATGQSGVLGPISSPNG
jgi:hypothetical protein